VSNELQEILDTVDIGAYLDREGVRYRPTSGTRGPQYNVKDCPVCGNAKWKVYLNQASGLGNCFAGDHPAGENFTKWKFIAAHLGTSNAAVAEHIKAFAREQGWRPARVVSAPVKPTSWMMPASYELPLNGRNLPYLENRGVSSVYAKYFHLRYAPDGAFYRYQLGTDWHFQDYSRRILIPIFDLDGKLVTFQGRDTTGRAAQKYLFPPQLDASGAHLFNGLNVIPGTKRVTVGEGAFDVAAIKIAFDQEADLRDVVPIGTFGKHLSAGDESGEGKDQLGKFLKLKERGLEEITLMWDGEVSATDAAINAGMMLKPYGFKVRIAMLPPDRDPNEVTADVVRRAYYEATLLDLSSAVRLRMVRRRMNGIAA
jgi:DNA primase